MSWKEETMVSLRTEFVQLAVKEEANFSELCRRFGVSRKTGYKWLRRYQAGGIENLQNRSRRPYFSPERTPEVIEAAILKVRQEHPAWGGRKIKRWLEDRGHRGLPSPSTITQILKRHNHIDPEEAKKHRPFQRFEMERPNQLWQMDFKGYFAMSEGGYCHPLTVLDDHSRFLLCLCACPNETWQTVQTHLTNVFRQYGLPERMLMDNGAPWGDDADTPHTVLTVWMLRFGIEISHGRPYHPQTQGKDERLHRTLNEELLSRQPMYNLSNCQKEFDRWRHLYNFERPHESLGMQTPITRYQPSVRKFPEALPPVVYEPGDKIRKVDASGKISFHGRACRVGKAFRGQLVALRPSQVDGVYEVFFCTRKVAKISLRGDNPERLDM